MLCFLKDVGKHYCSLIAFCQTTSRPRIHEAFHSIKFMQFMNKRLSAGDRDDLGLLEACSLFDPAKRRLNKPQRKRYIDRLLKAFPHADPIGLHNASGLDDEQYL